MSEDIIRDLLLQNDLPVPQLRYFDCTGSTNDVALHWAEEGALDGSLVVADTQTSGKGRLGRRWITNAGAALAFSLVFRPTQEEARFSNLFSPLGALALRQALDEHYGVQAQVKWPNDVLLMRKKVSGILAESNWLGGTLDAIILGIGINITAASIPPSDLTRFPAICIETVTNCAIDRWRLLVNVLRCLFDWRPRLPSLEFIQEWNRHLAFGGEQVMIHNAGDEYHVRGILTGVDTDGCLLLRVPDGSEYRISAGDVHLSPLHPDHPTQ